MEQILLQTEVVIHPGIQIELVVLEVRAHILVGVEVTLLDQAEAAIDLLEVDLLLAEVAIVHQEAEVILLDQVEVAIDLQEVDLQGQAEVAINLQGVVVLLPEDLHPADRLQEGLHLRVEVVDQVETNRINQNS